MQKNRVMLVADDIDVNRASFRAMFEEEYEVLEAGDGNETLKILEERKVDIVILDMCCLLYTSPSPRDRTRSRMPSSA